MGGIRRTSILLQRISLSSFRSDFAIHPNRVSPPQPSSLSCAFAGSRGISCTAFRCSENHFGIPSRKASSRLSQVQQILLESDAHSNQPPPKLMLEHVSISVAANGGGGPGRQHSSKVSTKVDMRFNVKNANWLSERIRHKILLLEKNRINKHGEIVVSSSKTRAQQLNIMDCLSKLQVIINAAAYVPPPPSEEQKKTIAELAALSEQKRLLNKKVFSQKPSKAAITTI